MRRIYDLKFKQRYIDQYSLEKHLSDGIIGALELRVYEMGEYIYRQDEEALTFYILVDGKLQTDFLEINGSQTVLSHSEPIATIGDLELFEEFHTVKNVLALETSTLFAVAMDTLRTYGQEDHRFLRFIIHHIVKKLDSSSNQLAQTSLPLESRLARYLLLQLKGKESVLKLERREVLAGILGTSVRHLNRTLQALSEEKIISVHYKSLEVINLKKLSIAANGPLN